MKHSRFFLKLILIIAMFLTHGCYSDLSHVKEEDYSGIVTKKYRIWQNNTPYVTVQQNGDKIIEVEIGHYQDGDYKSIVDYIEIGDSIYKPKGVYSMIIYKFQKNESKKFYLWLGGEMYTDE